MSKKQDFKSLYYSLYKVLYYCSLRIVSVPQQAEDIVQDVFMEYWSRYHSIDNEKSIKPYLYKAVRNKSLDYLKSAYHKRVQFDLSESILGEHLFAVLAADEALDNKNLVIELNKILANLSPKCKEVFLLSRKNHLSNKEIAEIKGVKLKTVEKQLTKALLEIKNHFKKMGYLCIYFF